MEENDFHKKFAIECFNDTWRVMNKENPTADDICEAIRLAHTSTWHWSKVGNELNQQRGEWICSRVYAHFGFGEMALYHAKRCFDLTQKHGFQDFDKGYSYEAMARAYKVLGNKDDAEKFLQSAQNTVDEIKEKEDRDLFLKDIEDLFQK